MEPTRRGFLKALSAAVAVVVAAPRVIYEAVAAKISPPPWVPKGADVYLDFVNGRSFINGVEGKCDDLLSYTRASPLPPGVHQEMVPGKGLVVTFDDGRDTALIKARASSRKRLTDEELIEWTRQET